MWSCAVAKANSSTLNRMRLPTSPLLAIHRSKRAIRITPFCHLLNSPSIPSIPSTSFSSYSTFNIDLKKSETTSKNLHFDLLVIGGGSGGISCARRASLENSSLKVGLVDAKPLDKNIPWGLGGTCVNVGCIPKKLMHMASLVHETVKEAESFGVNVDTKTLQIDWNTLSSNVHSYIRSVNFGYRSDLSSNHVQYINSFAKFIDPHTVELTNSKGVKQIVTADKFVIAVGGRPKIPVDIPGAQEYAITSDELFSLKKAPGKTLLVGASYIALECAGFLSGLGFEAKVMIRSIPLRGFDQECAERVVQFMKEKGTQFLEKSVPVSITKNTDTGKLVVVYKQIGEQNMEITKIEEFDTVMFAVGRESVAAKQMGLEQIGMELDHSTGKIITNIYEQSNLEHIYAIGDCIKDGLELTPVAIKAGSLLAKRLFGNSTQLMDYQFVPTTVFTPMEYGAIGFSEEKALEVYGKENIEIYHLNFVPLEQALPHIHHGTIDYTKCFVKLICLKTENERVIGFHYVGPNAGEVTQGAGVAIKCKATWKEFHDTVGIHPTNAEEMTTMTITKSSGKIAEKGGC